MRTRQAARLRAEPLGVAVVIVTYNSASFIEACIERLPKEVEIIVVDNGSKDGTPRLVEERFPHVRLVAQENLGFGAGCNRGVAETRGRIVAFLNPDTRPERGWLEALTANLVSGRIHTSQIIDDDSRGRLQTLGLDLHYTGIATLRGKGAGVQRGSPKEVPGLSGAAFAMLRTDYESLGGFDEGFFLYMEDVDLSWRARRAGMTIWGIPESRVRHQPAGRLNAAKLAHLRAGRRRLIHTHLRPRTRLFLAPALAMVTGLEAIAGLRWGRARSPTSLPKDPPSGIQGRPPWLRFTIPFRLITGSLVGLLLTLAVNPFLVLNALCWPREQHP